MDEISLVKQRRFLTREEEAEILILKARSKISDHALAEQYGVSRSTITRLKRRWSPTVKAAHAFALSKALDVMKTGIHAIDTYGDAMDFCERMGAVQPKPEPVRTQGNQVQVIVGRLPGHDDDEIPGLGDPYAS